MLNFSATLAFNMLNGKFLYSTLLGGLIWRSALYTSPHEFVISKQNKKPEKPEDLSCLLISIN